MMNGPVGAFLDGFNSLFKTINSSPIAKFVTGSVMIAGLLGSTALIAASIAQLATKGTFFNPMFVKDIMEFRFICWRKRFSMIWGSCKC
jgi:hypothetical protein